MTHGVRFVVSLSRFLTLALGALWVTALAACSITPPASTPIRPETAAQGIALVRALPADLPNKAVAVPHAQCVLVPNESAAGQLSEAAVLTPIRRLP